MFRIGILGSDNSHALNFSKMCNIPNANGEYRYPDVRIVAIHGHNDNPQHTKSVAEEGRIEHIVNSPEEMFGLVDAVMVVHRHGCLHMEQALPFIERGYPVWIDKPIVTTWEDALRLRKAVKKHNALICGGSSLRFSKQVKLLKNAVKTGELGEVVAGSISFPADRNSQYNGIFFYGPHICRILNEIFGYDVQSVIGLSAARYSNAAIARYSNNVLVTLTMNDKCWDNYVTINGTKKSISLRIDLDDIFVNEMDSFVEALRSGKSSETIDKMLCASYLLMSLDKSFKTGTEVKVPTDRFKFGVITDEVSQNIEEAAEFASKNNFKGLEIRSVFGKATHELSEDDISKIKDAIAKYGLVCCGISSPFFKCNMQDSAEVSNHIEILKKCIKLAKELNTNTIRGFGFWRDGVLQENLDRIAELFAEPIKLLNEAGMTLVLETEPTTYLSDGYSLKLLLEKINSPCIKGLWDPGNDLYSDSNEKPFPDGYDNIKQYIHHVHIKDAYRLNGKTEGVKIGEGEVDYIGQFEQFARDGYKGWCVLETHYRKTSELSEEELKRPGGYSFSAGGREASEECVQGLFEMLDKIGLGIRE